MASAHDLSNADLHAVRSAADREERSDDAAQLRLAALQPFLWSLFAVAFAIVMLSPLSPYTAGTPIELLFLALLAIGVAGLYLAPRYRRIGTVASIAGLFALVYELARTVPDGGMTTLFSPLTMVAVITLGPAPGIIVAVGALAATAAMLSAPTPPLTPAIATTTGILVGFAVLIGWAATRTVFTALGWAWSSYAQALATTRELRERQQELTSALKSLNEAFDRLENLNDELARARVIAEDARRLKAEFAANVSHELRTPLNLIVGFSEVMTTTPQSYGGEQLPDSYLADLDAIYRSARHLSSLIDDVLDLSQIEAGRIGLVREHLSLGEVVTEACAAVSPLFVAKRLYLRNVVPDNLPLVSADRTRLRQVFINLFSNAVRFTESGGVTVEACLRDGDVEAIVRDTGIGIPPASLTRIFEDFYQVDRSLRRGAGGSGLGLSISKQLIEANGGAIWVRSTVGEGSEFHLTVPRFANLVKSIPPGELRLWDQRQLAAAADPPLVAIVSTDPIVPRLFERHLKGVRIVGIPSIQDAHRTIRDRGTRAIIRVAASDAEASDALFNHVDVDEASGISTVPQIVCSLPNSQSDIADPAVIAQLVKPIARAEVVGILERLGPDVKNVLIVDDDPDMLRLLGRMIRSAGLGHRVWRANSGSEALSLLREHRPDAVLLDLLMPDVDGYAVLREMRQDSRLISVPVVIITARSGRERTLSSGLIAITRPTGISVRELMGCIEGALKPLLEGPGQSRSEPTRERREAAAD